MNRSHLGFTQKLFLSLGTCLAVCLLVVMVYTRTNTRATLRSNALETGMATTDNRATLLELNLAQIAKLSSNLYSNVDVYSLLRKENLDTMDSYRISLFLRSMLSMYAEVKISQIYLDIYSSGQSFVIDSGGNSASGPSRYHVVIPQYIESEQVYCDGPHIPSHYGYSLSPDTSEVFTFHWKLYDNAQTHVIGTISFDVALNDMLTYVFPQPEETGFLLSSGNIIFANNCTLTNQEARSILRSCTRTRWTEVHEPYLDGIAFFSALELSNVDLQLVQMIPSEVLYADSDRLLRRNMTMIILSFLLCGAVMYLILNQAMTPVRRLDQGLQRIQQANDLSLRMKDTVNYDGNDEIGRLILQTDQMLDTVETLFQRQEMLSTAQRDAEARMLQAQINPHFLYNSLQSLAGLALERGQKDIFQYITMLGSRMHYSMDTENTTALLSQEFDYVHSYVILQNVRFRSGITEQVHLTPEAASVVVPRMILQPIVENAFKHGKLCRFPNTYMHMSGSVENDTLTILLENNGYLIPEDRLEELNRLLAVPGVPHASITKHIGMLSVLYRLRLFFQDDVTMEVQQPEQRCVRTTITIPLHTPS